MIARGYLTRNGQPQKIETMRLAAARLYLESSAGARKPVCEQCQQIRRNSDAFPIQRLSSHRRLANSSLLVKRIFARDGIRASRHFTTARPLRANGQRDKVAVTGGDIATGSEQETFDERVSRIIQMTRRRWNELVGYTDIEKERRRVEAQEDLIEQKRLELQESRDAYRSAVDKHAMSLRESRDLLGRKDEWSESDAARFAALHTMVKTNENVEYGTRQALQAAELGLEREIERLSSKIGAVYQAESMYNSKILQMKTWWTWALFIFNGSVFAFNLYLLQVGLNPRSRNAEIVLADETIQKIGVRLAQSVAAAASVSTGEEIVLEKPLPKDVALGPLLFENGSVFYRDSCIEVAPTDKISDVKRRIQEIEGTSMKLPRLFMDGSELEDGRMLQEVSTVQPHLIEVLAVDSGHALTRSLAMTPEGVAPRPPSLMDRLRDLQGSQSASPTTQEVALIAIPSAIAGATLAGLVTLALGRS